LAKVGTTKARLDRIPQILKTFRQSVLSAAVSGKLTEEWRTNNEILIHDWIDSNVGKLAIVATGTTPKRTNSGYWENGVIPWLTSTATGNDFIFEAEQFVTDLAVKECRLKVFEAGTLLLAMYGEGKTRGQVTEIKISATCNQACAAIIVDDTLINRDFLKIRLLENYEETRKAAVGGAQPNLNLSKVRDIPVLLPKLVEQTEIVRRVEELFDFANSIEQKANSALEHVNKMTQSILAKAFRGELTADWRASNPDLISGDNSAEALLTKISAESEALKKKPKPKRNAVKKKAGSSMSKQMIKIVEALKEAGKPLSGQKLLAAAGYPSDSSTDQLERFFLDIRDALTVDKSIVKVKRDDDEQDWFTLAEVGDNE
jgi:type I restriction enzyme S subunit